MPSDISTLSQSIAFKILFIKSKLATSSDINIMPRSVSILYHRVPNWDEAILPE